MIREKYPEFYEDCGTKHDEKCPEGYSGADYGTKEYKEVMKFTSAVGMFKKLAVKRAKHGAKYIYEKFNKKTEAATGGHESGKECAPGQYAEAAAAKPAKVPDITLKGKRYNCKGGARIHPPPQRLTTLTIVAAIFARARVPTVPFKSVPRGVRTRTYNNVPTGGLLQTVPEVRGVSGESKLRRGSNEGRSGGNCDRHVRGLRRFVPTRRVLAAM